MAHTHSHSESRTPTARASPPAFAVTALFMVAEVIGGLDVRLAGPAGRCRSYAHRRRRAADGAAGRAVRPAQTQCDRHTFGLLRLTTLAAFVNAIALLLITVLIVWEAH